MACREIDVPVARVRKRSTSHTRYSRRALERDRVVADETRQELGEIAARPATRAECLPGGRNAERPCPYVSCSYHLAIDVTDAGSLTENFPDTELHELAETCALDVASREGETLEGVGRLTNLTRERVRQIELKAFARVRVSDLGALASLCESAEN